jgi:hypothetical protein
MVKDHLYLHPEIAINVIMGDCANPYQNGNGSIYFNINYEHTLVVPGGRDTGNSPHGQIPTIQNKNQNYLVRIDNYGRLVQSEIIIDYSIPNLINIDSSGLFSEYSNKTICISPLLYPQNTDKDNRSIQCLTTFINTEEPRRKRLIENLLKTPILQHTNVNNCFNRESIIALYRNTRILINIHQTDHHHTCEELRILPALLSGVIVICEESPLYENIPYHDYIIWTKYEDIVDCVEKVQSNYDVYYSKFFEGENLNKLTNVLTKIEKKNRHVLQEQIFKMSRQHEKFNDVYFGQFSEMTVRTLHNAGFFSCCSVLLHLIVHYINTYKRLPRFLDTQHTFHWYKPTGQETTDIYPVYFKGVPESTDESIQYTQDINYTENDQFKPFENVEFEKLFPLIKRFFTPSDEIEGIVENIKQKYNIDYDNTCALFLRGNDKSTECSIPDYGFYREHAHTIMGEHSNIRFMIQSDETEFIATMTNEFANSFYCRDEIRHICKANTTVDVVFKDTNHEYSKKFLAIMCIMSRCKYVVCNYGNCSIWIALFRNHINNIIEYNPRDR